MKCSFFSFAFALLALGCGREPVPSPESSTPSLLLSGGAAASPERMLPNFSPTPTPLSPQFSPSPEPSSPQAPNNSLPQSSDYQQAAARAQATEIACPKGGCNPSVGLLSFVRLKPPSPTDQGGWRASQCTATLVGDNVAVTNAHCIPDDIAAAGSDCSGRIWLSFGKNSKHAEYERQLGCRKVLQRQFSGGNAFTGGYFDYAFIELDKSSKRPIRSLSRSGFQANQRYDIWKVDPIDKPAKIAGQMKHVQCRAEAQSGLFSPAIDSDSTSYLLADCPIVSGNSGAPAFDSKGLLTGVIFSLVVKDILYKTFQRHGSKLPAEIANLGLATNFACLPLPSVFTENGAPDHCDNSAERIVEKRDEEMAGFLAPFKIDSAVAEKLKNIPITNAFGWEFRSNLELFTFQDDSGARIPQIEAMALGWPKCVKPSLAISVGAGSILQRPRIYFNNTYDFYMRVDKRQLFWGELSSDQEQVFLEKAEAGYELKILDPEGRLEATLSLPACS